MPSTENAICVKKYLPVELVVCHRMHVLDLILICDGYVSTARTELHDSMLAKQLLRHRKI